MVWSQQLAFNKADLFQVTIISLNTLSGIHDVGFFGNEESFRKENGSNTMKS